MEYLENKELEEKEIKGIFTDMMKYAPSKLCGMMGNVITVPLYTSLFSTEQYGLYTISIAMLSFLCIIFSDWVGLSGLRFFRKHQLEQDLPKYLTTIITMLSINMVLMFSLAFIFKDWMYSFFHVPFKYFLAVLVLIIPVAIRALLQQILRAQLKSGSYSFTTILNQFATIFLAWFFAKYFNYGAASILLAMGVAISLIDVLLLCQCNILSVLKFKKPEWKFILPIVKYGIPVAATSLSAWIINQGNKFVMNGIHGFSKAALIGVGYSMTLPILMSLFSIITVAAIPRIYNMYEAKVDVRPITSRILSYFIIVALPLVSVISMYSVEYTQMFTNEKFYEASVLIPFLSFGVFFLAMTDYTTMQYHLANKTYIELGIKLVSGISGLILNWIFIMKMGLVGAGFATMLANLIYLMLTTLIILPGLELKFPRYTLLRLLTTYIPAGIIFYAIKTYCSFIPYFAQMLIVLTVFYLSYYVVKKLLIKSLD